MATIAPPQALGIVRTSPERAREVSEAEVRTTLDILRELDHGEWSIGTPCEGWRVRDIVAHEVGQFEELPRPWLMVSRTRRGRTRYPRMKHLDGRNQCQVQDRNAVPPAELIDLLESFAHRGLQAVDRVPVAVRQKMRLSPIMPEAKDLPEDSMDYLVRVIVPRDTWMHRVDICDATGRELVLGEHDKEIVGQVLLDLAIGWQGPPAALDLTGPVGGKWRLGSGEPVMTVHADAVTVMRHLSGRPPRGTIECDGEHVATEAFKNARVIF